jgi:hypothetical protein
MGFCPNPSMSPTVYQKHLGKPTAGQSTHERPALDTCEGDDDHLELHSGHPHLVFGPTTYYKRIKEVSEWRMDRRT